MIKFFQSLEITVRFVRFIPGSTSSQVDGSRIHIWQNLQHQKRRVVLWGLAVGDIFLGYVKSGAGIGQGGCH